MNSALISVGISWIAVGVWVTTDLNFEKNKPFANIIKATTDVELKFRNFGFFGRGSAYYDFDLHDSDKLGPTGRDRLGKDYVGLDGFVYASDTNTEWMSIEALRTWIDANRDRIGHL